MKINDSVKKPSSPSVGATQTRPGNSAGKAEATPAAGDNVHLSSQVQKLSAQVASTGVFDAGKVQEIKSAIADGRFQVDPEKVANGLLDTVHDLIHSQKKKT